jgi:hypothetical protein
VFRHRQGRWQRNSGFSSDWQIEAYRVPSRDTAVFLTTLETWTRADGSESRVKLWREDGGQLHSIARTDTTLFQDADVTVTDTAVLIVASQFPSHVSACVLCTRLVFAHAFTASATGIRQRTVSLNPWAMLVDSLYGMTARGQTRGVSALLPRTVSLKSIWGHDAGFVAADSGDFQAGNGRADVLVSSTRNCYRYRRFWSARQPSGFWRIVAVQAGHGERDSLIFDDRASGSHHSDAKCS